MRFFHLTTTQAWDEAQRTGAYRPESLAREGFVHLSEERQWRATAARFFRGKTDLVLLVIDGARLSAEVRHEAADGDSFPHLFGALEVEAVVEALAISVGDDGSVVEPRCVVDDAVAASRPR